MGLKTTPQWDTPLGYKGRLISGHRVMLKATNMKSTFMHPLNRLPPKRRLARVNS